MTIRSDKHIHGFISVLAAILGNLVVTILKFTGFFLSGSSALFSEGVHSFADTMNQSLLMVGIKKSGRVADKNFSYGYGQERFLWALISACGIFFLGAGVTTYHGIDYLLKHKTADLGELTFIILALSFIIEFFTLYTAIAELRHSRPGARVKELFRDGDPTTIAVVYEDSVALLGLLVALLSVILTKVTGDYYWDGIGSIIIGMMLGVMAIILINKNRSFLIGKAIPEETKERIIELLLADPAIEKVLDFKSSILDVGRYHIKCEVEFNGASLLAEEYLGGSLIEEYESTRENFEKFKKFMVGYADRVPRVIGKKIDELEKRVRQELPEAVHIDIEIN